MGGDGEGPADVDLVGVLQDVPGGLWGAFVGVVQLGPALRVAEVFVG